MKVARYVLKERGEEVTPPSTLTDIKTADDLKVIELSKNGPLEMEKGSKKGKPNRQKPDVKRDTGEEPCAVKVARPVLKTNG